MNSDTVMPLVRAFLAIPLNKEVREALTDLQKNLGADWPGVRWTGPDHLHLTLRFFGDLPEECLEKIGEVMLSVKSFTAPFSAPVRGIGAFPSTTRPRVIWAGVQGGAPLASLYVQLENGLSGIGLPPEERPFTPHLTLGRCRIPFAGAAKVLSRFRNTDLGSLNIDRLILYESRLGPDGATHIPRKCVTLG
ncbi:RNA 2',3'-cyclic phosphodiesterase [Desulfuromonas sp. AOP6]|uniref:RNA 2',3'-cyclic phosphodiesterase n=1 Tax=Desulfuromonas sp. AOP6 TaxID=1566351 RepID=UPI0012842458|nr:RNA 2',3'-cyclic phosphodiesterase [Desulfuromonas sp. AOP6]BCA78794.1 RNA 2',3'-cyclic phosphodiesterase [Desulfuromonas sp. AOP6]